MSQADMESLLRYEQTLVACYEAEYLLEVSMRCEHISTDGAAGTWGGYDDCDDVVPAHPSSLPPPPPPPPASTHHNLPAEEGMECEALPSNKPTFSPSATVTTTAPLHSLSLGKAFPDFKNCSTALTGLPHQTHSSPLPQTSFRFSLTPPNTRSLRLPPSSFSSTLPSNGLPCWTTPTAPSHLTWTSNSYQGDDHCNSRCHSDEPLKKKFRMHPPEL